MTFTDVVIGLSALLVGWLLPSFNVLLAQYKIAKYAKIVSMVLVAIDPLIRENIDKWGKSEVYDEIRSLILRFAGKPLESAEVEFVLEHIIKVFDPGKFLQNLRAQENNPFQF